MEKYDHKKIEAKWQKRWSEHPELYAADDESKAEKRYILDMFPYPSGDGLHVGHVESYTATDIVSRYLRMNGKNVLHPQGWDAFGLPAENYAIKTKIHPAKTTRQAMETFKRQMKLMGFSYDWSRELNSSEPEYYKWTQWFFLLLYKNGLAYKAKAKVNWCASCQTVLANEQAEGGVCERCGNPVTQKQMEQWFFKITDFIEDKTLTPQPPFERGAKGGYITSGLINGLDKVDWPESTKAAQKNWIGKSTGAVFELRITNSELRIKVFTTRLDTVFGMTYVVLAPEHPVIQNYKLQITNYKEVERYVIRAKNKTDLERMETKEKTGVKLEGVEAINPFNGEEVPIWVADYVLAQYGTGAVMAVPAHDERDWEFAKKYGLPIRQSIAEETGIKRANEEKRDGAFAYVFDPVSQKYAVGKDLAYGWVRLFSGGVDGGENMTKGVKREVTEESGLYDFELAEEIGTVFPHYHNKSKNIDRTAEAHGFLVILKSKKSKPLKLEEHEKFKLAWVTAEEMEKSWRGHVPVDDYIHWIKFLPLAVSRAIELGFDKTTDRKKFIASAYTEDGTLVNSGEYSGLASEQAREKMTAWLEKQELGKRKVNYKIRDWLISRQRYWGAPIPIIYCEKCGTMPVPEKDLPVRLPADVDFMPTGESPLVKSKKFHDVKCPVCGRPARRESDTMDTFVCSSWYYFRYADVHNKKEFASREMLKRWLPVDLYVGGAEHTVLHLLYSRFFTKVLNYLGYIDFDEPFLKMRHQGIILAEDGRKMSKSLGNVMNPDDVVKEYGADALRMFEMFMGPLEDMKPWNTRGIVGISRFFEKIWKLKSKVKSQKSKVQVKSQKLEKLLHKTIKKVAEDIENMKFNTAISALMILVNVLEKEKEISVIQHSLFITLLSPFAPHLAEELWSGLGHEESIFKQSWPKFNSALVKEEVINLVIQINGKVRDTVEVSVDISEEEAEKIALASKKVKKRLESKEVVKIIFVKGKLVNIVVK